MRNVTIVIYTGIDEQIRLLLFGSCNPIGLKAVSCLKMVDDVFDLANDHPIRFRARDDTIRTACEDCNSRDLLSSITCLQKYLLNDYQAYVIYKNIDVYVGTYYVIYFEDLKNGKVTSERFIEHLIDYIRNEYSWRMNDNNSNYRSTGFLVWW